MSAGATPILLAQEVTLRFGGLTALDRVSFDVSSGEIFGLIGPNGAGKTTLMNAINGIFRPNSGTLTFDGRPITGLAPHRIARRGIARTFQVMRPFAGMSVRENVAIGARFGRADGPSSMSAALAKADEALALMGLADLATVGVADLTTGQRKKLELARALAMDPKLLLLDEVMAGLNPREIGEVMELVRRVNGMGVTVMLIEHLMKAVMGLCDRILVLHHGGPIALGTPDEVTHDQTVIRAYLGERYATRHEQVEEALR
jgi:branched-chain amino acid transport system ATP-binding protein